MIHPSPPIDDRAFALTNATVLTMRDQESLPRHTLVVRDGRIGAIAPSAEYPVPRGVYSIDATGWYLLPGLADMHVHLLPVNALNSIGVLDEDLALKSGADFLRVLLAHGITTVRNMAGTPFHLKLRDAVRRGELTGPRIQTAGPILESRFTFPQLAQFGQLVTTPEEARAVVREQHALGYDCIKVYNDLDPDVYDAIVEAARERGLQVVGHVAYAKGLSGALAARQDSIEHFRAYDVALDTRAVGPSERFAGWLHTDATRIREVAERTAESGTWNVPTLVVERALAARTPGTQMPHWLPPWLEQALILDDTHTFVPAPFIQRIRAGIDRRLEFVAAMDRAGARLLAGSDCPGCGLVPGRSLHEELTLFVAAGLSPQRALLTGTADAAAFLGRAHELGRLTPGMLADVVALGRDPRVSLDALADVRGVVAAGRWHTIDALTGHPSAAAG
jgi:imidazolonepropionase-like amidohydrolase